MLLTSKNLQWVNKSKQGTAREKTASCILNLLLDFESYLKNSSKKLQFFLCLFITVKATRTAPKAVVGLSRGNVEISHFSTRRKFCFLTTLRMGWWSTSRKCVTAQEMNTTDHTSDWEAVSVQTRLQVVECNINRSITIGKIVVWESSLNEKKNLCLYHQSGQTRDLIIISKMCIPQIKKIEKSSQQKVF